MSLAWAEPTFLMAQSMLGTWEVPGGTGPKKTFQNRGRMNPFSLFVIHVHFRVIFVALQATDWQLNLFFSLFLSFLFPSANVWQNGEPAIKKK